MGSLEEGETPTAPTSVPYPLPNDTNGDILNRLHPSTASSSSAPPAAANENEDYPIAMEPEDEPPGHATNPTAPSAPTAPSPPPVSPQQPANDDDEYPPQPVQPTSSSAALPWGVNPVRRQGKGKNAMRNKKAIPTNKPLLLYLDIANDPYSIMAW